MTRPIRRMHLLGCPASAGFAVAALAGLAFAPPMSAQEPASWGNDLVFHTFSIAAVDPNTGESGVAVTTRVACVGNGVPWVRAGVGAVATQASTRTAYGQELLDMLEQGMSPQEALDQATAADDDRDRRQIGVVSLDGQAAQHTGSDRTTLHKGMSWSVQGSWMRWLRRSRRAKDPDGTLPIA